MRLVFNCWDLTIFFWKVFNWDYWSTASTLQSGCVTRSDQKVREIQIPVIHVFKTCFSIKGWNYSRNSHNYGYFVKVKIHYLVAFLLGQFWLWGMTQRFSVAFPTKVGTGRHVLWTYMHIYCEVMWTKQNVLYVFPIRIVETQHYIYVPTFVKVKAWNWVDSNLLHLAWHLS